MAGNESHDYSIYSFVLIKCLSFKNVKRGVAVLHINCIGTFSQVLYRELYSLGTHFSIQDLLISLILRSEMRTRNDGRENSIFQHRLSYFVHKKVFPGVSVTLHLSACNTLEPGYFSPHSD